MSLDIQAAKKRCEAATEAWVAEGTYVSGRVPNGRPNGEIIGRFQPSRSGIISVEQDEANAEFAAHARSDLPAALEALEEARELFGKYGRHHPSCMLEHHAPGVRDCGCGYVAALRTILGESK